MTNDSQNKSSSEPAQYAEYFSRLATAAGDLRGYLDQGVRQLRGLGFSSIGLFWKRDEGLDPVMGPGTERSRLGFGPVQEQAFHSARARAAEGGEIFYLESGRLPPGKTVADIEGSPPETSEPTIFNGTPEDFMVLPVRYMDKVVGVLEAFAPADDSGRAREERLAALGAFGAGIADLVKNQNVSKITAQITAGLAFANMLEALLRPDEESGHFIQIVNHARDLTGADRVCLFTAEYPVAVDKLGQESTFGLAAVSGIDEINHRSAQAAILYRAGQALLTAAAKQQAESESKAGKAGRRAALVGVAAREHPDPASRPQDILAYFEELPSQWVTALALYDERKQVVGVLMCEGMSADRNLQRLLEALRPLANPVGLAVARKVEETGQPALRMARRWVRWRGEPRRGRRGRRWLAAITVFLVVMLFPIRFNVSAEALLQPRMYQTLAAAFTGRLAELNIQQGDMVEAGSLLAAFDQEENRLAMLEAEAELRRLRSEVEIARQQGREHEARLLANDAEKARVKLDLARHNMENAELHAPFHARVIGPENLRHRRGTFFSRGESVVELAGVEEWRVAAYFREQDLPLLEKLKHQEEELPAELTLQASPGESWALSLPPDEPLAFNATVGPSNEAALRLYFPIQQPEALPVDLADEFSGKVRVDLGYRPVAYVLFRDFVNYIRYRF